MHPAGVVVGAVVVPIAADPGDGLVPAGEDTLSMGDVVTPATPAGLVPAVGLVPEAAGTPGQRPHVVWQ